MEANNIRFFLSRLKFQDNPLSRTTFLLTAAAITLSFAGNSSASSKKSERVVAGKNAFDLLREVDSDIQDSVKKLSADDFKNREELINVVCSKQLPILQPACKSLFDRYYHSYKVGKSADLEEYKRVVLKK
ncbi:hypothetical protein FDP41_013354 [Naegleria fowleri]|uniref:Uncharacterized protein n=1 Tax=Naegleria fowleri TaxID=5763 RepID=A0A6A5C2R1_NAEFO|nr:uncharacterized protein FDP41_013354 [Naegleria fowleri]KAF0980140.1 hypothetical protein FDP41_013354 [Naegleria fowleri]